MNNDNSIYEWAQKYLQHGYSVIPIGKDKKPLIDWKKYQNERATQEEIKSWFDKDNPPNIGIVTGRISNVTVVDIEAGGKWEHYPVTQSSRSGGGGVHLYYKYAQGISNSARIKELTDIRGDGGYIVAPPSIHASGNKYEWFRKELVQPFPYQMFGATPSNIKKADWQEVLGGVGAGERNQTAAQVIGKFISVLAPEEWATTAWQMFVHWNATNTPPLPDRELRGVFNSIIGRAVRNNQHNKPKDKISGDVLKSSQEEDCEIKLISEIAKELGDDLSVRYATGYKVIDEAFKGGLKDGDLWFVTGYSGQGKTSICQTMTYNLIKSGQPILWFSYEVLIQEIWRKFQEMGVKDDFMAYAPAVMLNGKIDWVEKKILEARDKFKTKIVFIDHLGFLAPDVEKYDQNLNSNYSTYLGVICRQLKSIAIREKIAIVLMGHLRKPANGKVEDPTIHDIKDSAGVGQESDAVLIVNRKRTQKETSGFAQRGGEEELFTDETEVKIEKNRVSGVTKKFVVKMINGKLLDFDQEIEEMGFNVK